MEGHTYSLSPFFLATTGLSEKVFYQLKPVTKTCDDSEVNCDGKYLINKLINKVAVTTQ